MHGELFTASARGSRRLPQLVACANPEAVAQYILSEVLRYRRAELCSMGEIAILYTGKNIRTLEPVANALIRQFGPDAVHCQWRGGARPDSALANLRMVTVHGAKGLEWRVVFVLGLDETPRPNFDLEKERSLAYVALTRAEDEVHVVSLRTTGYHQELQSLIPSLGGTGSPHH